MLGSTPRETGRILFLDFEVTHPTDWTIEDLGDAQDRVDTTVCELEEAIHG